MKIRFVILGIAVSIMAAVVSVKGAISSWKAYSTGAQRMTIATSLQDSVGSTAPKFRKKARLAAPSSTPGTQKVPDDSLGYYEGHKLLRGPRGGIYYINSSGNKTYVKRTQ
jgi:hypothetical protein